MEHSAQFLRRRKFFTILPMLVLPFVTLAFWALGGGQGGNTQSTKQPGLNKELPDAKLPATAMDKLSLYNEADKDSLALKQKASQDPYADQDSLAATGKDSSSLEALSPGWPAGSGSGLHLPKDPNEERMQRRLAQLERSLQEPASSPKGNPMPENTGPDLGQLQSQLQQTATKSTDPDPELDQMNSMLEKIMDIQYPNRMQEKLRQESQKNRGQVYAVTHYEPSITADLMTGYQKSLPGNTKVLMQSTMGSRFYDLDQPIVQTDTIRQQAIPAVIHETQTLVSGASIKMHLSADVFINGMKIPTGTILSGVCNVNGERLQVDVTSIRYGNNIFPISLAVYDLDALPGIRIPDAISRTVAKESADRSLQGVQLMSLDPSLATQAASAGLEAAKGLFSKKVKLIRVTVKAGHPVLLVDMKSKQTNN